MHLLSELVFEVVCEEWLSNISKNRSLSFRFVCIISVTKPSKRYYCVFCLIG